MTNVDPRRPGSSSDHPVSPLQRGIPSYGIGYKIAILYGVLALLWNTASSSILHALFLDRARESVAEFARDWLFVIGTAVLLGFALERYFGQIRRSAKLLQESEDRMRGLFDSAPLPLWEEDFSAVRRRLTELSIASGEQLGAFLEKNPNEIKELAALVQILDFNPETVKFFGVTSREEVWRRLPDYFDESSLNVFAEELKTLCDGGKRFECEIPIKTMTGETRELFLILRVATGAEKDWSRIYVSFVDITARKLVETVLRRSEAKWRTYLENAPVGVLVADQSGRHTDANRAAELLLGYEPGEILQTSIGDIPAPESAEAARNHLADAAKSGMAEGEFVLRRKDGGRIWAMVRAARLPDGGYLSVIQDNTQRNKAAKLVIQNVQRTEFLLELHQRSMNLGDKQLYDYVLDKAVQLTDSAIGFFHQISDDQSTVILTTWNRGALENCKAEHNTHYPLREAGNWVDCVRQQRPIVYNDFAHSPNQHGLPAGHTVLHRFMSIPVIENGKVRIIFGVGNKGEDYTDEDISQLQLAANELHKIMGRRAAEKQVSQLSRAVEQSPASIIMTDSDGTIEYVNPRFSEITGYSFEEVRGKNPRILKSSKTPADSYKDLWRTLLEGKVWHGEFCNKKKNGDLYWESGTISPVIDYQGRITHFVAVREDLTQRREAEEQLRQSQKLEAIGQLAGGVAHDFNNILAATMMNLGLLQMNPNLDDETRRGVKDLFSEARRAADLTRQLLMFSRRSVLAIKSLDINEIVTNLLKMLGRLIGEHIELRFEVRSGLPQIEADSGMLEQVIVNLVVNARDAISSKGGRITLETSAVEFRADGLVSGSDRRAGRFVCLMISDTGCGMSEDTVQRIFEPFFTTKEAGKGTGLGLATVHGIIAQHKGWIEVESRVGAGSAFKVYFPISEKPQRSLTSADPTRPSRVGHEVILLVEDDARVRRTVSQALKTFGYRVHEAANGQDAVGIWTLHKGEVDLLFTDMVMPEGMTGLELIEKLRQSKRKLKAIISSGYSADFIHAGIPNKSGITYLPKPYQTEQLAEVVRNCLDQQE